MIEIIMTTNKQNQQQLIIKKNLPKDNDDPYD